MSWLEDMERRVTRETKPAPLPESCFVSVKHDAWRQKRNDAARKSNAIACDRKKRAGLCIRCGKPRAPHSSSRCERCLAKHRRRAHP